MDHCFGASEVMGKNPGDAVQEWARLLGEQSKGEMLQYAVYVAGVVDDWADLDEVDEARMLHCFK